MDKAEGAVVQFDAEKFAPDLLEEGEKIVWTGRPDPERAARLDGHAKVRSVAMIVTSALILLWQVAGDMVLQLAADMLPEESLWLFLLFAAVFGSTLFLVAALIGLSLGLLLSFKPIFNRRRAARTHYLVTDRRILIVSERTGRWTRNMSPEQIETLRRKNSDGWSDIRFVEGESYWHRAWSNSFWARFLSQFDDGFWGIEDGDGAERAIRGLMKSAHSAGASSVFV